MKRRVEFALALFAVFVVGVATGAQARQHVKESGFTVYQSMNGEPNAHGPVPLSIVIREIDYFEQAHVTFTTFCLGNGGMNPVQWGRIEEAVKNAQP